MDYQSIFESDFGIQKIKYTGNQGMGLCPFHDDRNPSLSWQLDTGLWTCFSGCGSGNTYQFAERLKLPNPHQYIESSTVGSKNYRNGEYKLINTFKSEDTDVFQVDKIERLEQLKERYGKNHFRADSMILGKDKFTGKDDDGKAVFFYEYGIKYHKCSPFWHPDSLDKGLQIFMADLIDENQDTLYICEGEKDAYNFPSWLNAVCFSAGACSIPKDLSSIYYDNLKTIVIPYDKDKAGNGGMKKLAGHIKFERPGLIVRMLKWDDGLPDGFDITDALDKGMDFFNGVLENTEEYTLPVKTKTKGFDIMNMKDFVEKYKDEDTTPIIKHLVGEKNITLISGDVDVGKTWVSTHMGLSIATGTPFFGTPISKKKRVVMFQFELNNAEVSERMKKLHKSYGWINNFQIKIIDEDEEIFVDSWQRIEDTCINESITDSVIIVDNLYTSTDKDVSVNADLQVVIRHARRIINKTGNAMILVGHHNKKKSENLPILEMDLIQGGRTLTANVNYILQLGKSTYSPDIKRGKITKTRGGYYEMKDIPFMIHFDHDTAMFRKGVIILNETAHTVEYEKRWEIEIAKEFSGYQGDKEFDKSRFWQFLSTEQGWERTESNNTKVSRLLKTLVEWGMFKHPDLKKPYNSYQVDLEAVASITKERK